MPSPLVRLPPLDLVKGFVAVGRRMSITHAADDMCVTQSAMSKQVRALEDGLGVRLFERGYRSIAFTPAGRQFFAAADELISKFQKLAESVPVGMPRPVTISASIGTTGLWLLPRLSAFQQEHPEIEVRIAADNRVLDLALEDVDLAIRYCPGDRAPAGAEPLFGETIAPVAAPALLADWRVERDGHLQGLREVNLLEFDEVRQHPWLGWSEWLAPRGLTLRDSRGVVRFNQYDQLIQAAVAGQGIALGRLELLSAALAAGQLALLDPAEPAVRGESGYWLVRGRNDQARHVAVVREWLLSCARETRASLAPLSSALRASTRLTPPAAFGSGAGRGEVEFLRS